MAKRQTIQWQKDRQYNSKKTDNTMAKRQTIQWQKDKQYNGKKTDNTMAKRKKTKRQTITYKTLFFRIFFHMRLCHIMCALLVHSLTIFIKYCNLLKLRSISFKHM